MDPRKNYVLQKVQKYNQAGRLSFKVGATIMIVDVVNCGSVGNTIGVITLSLFVLSFSFAVRSDNLIDQAILSGVYDSDKELIYDLKRVKKKTKTRK